MEKSITKIRENREKCIKLQQKMKKSSLSICKEIIEEYLINDTSEQLGNPCSEFNSIAESVNVGENDEIDDAKIDIDILEKCSNTNNQLNDISNEFNPTVKEVDTEENNENNNVEIDKNEDNKNTMDYLLNIELKINNIKKDLYYNSNKYSMEKNNELIKELNYFKALYSDLINGNYVIVKF